MLKRRSRVFLPVLARFGCGLGLRLGVALGPRPYFGPAPDPGKTRPDTLLYRDSPDAASLLPGTTALRAIFRGSIVIAPRAHQLCSPAISTPDGAIFPPCKLHNKSSLGPLQTF